jgi:hypothetical protein
VLVPDPLGEVAATDLPCPSGLGLLWTPSRQAYLQSITPELSGLKPPMLSLHRCLSISSPGWVGLVSDGIAPLCSAWL